MARLIFIGEKLVLEKLESPLILIYLKGKIKQERKPLRNVSIVLEKQVLKIPSLGPGIKLPIRKVPLRGNTLLSPKEVSND